MSGAFVIAKALKAQGVKVIFGIVGIPVIEVAEACRMEGIQFVGCRNEQTASYAANAWGYLTGTPGVCLVVSGPGLVHALAGLANAKENGFPMLLIAGSSDVLQESKGAFQEMNQVEATRLYTKYSARPSSIEMIPFFIEKAMRTSITGRPGACYLDIPGSFITGSVEKEDEIVYFDNMKQHFLSVSPEYPLPLFKTFADPVAVKKAVSQIAAAKNPLVIIGKSANMSRGADITIMDFLSVTNFPFVPTPMGKGVVSDLYNRSVAAARSSALKNADIIILCGARLNWILHFGEYPRFRKDVKFIQIDTCPEEIGNNICDTSRCFGLVGDVASIVSQLTQELTMNREGPVSLPAHSKWWTMLRQKVEENQKKTNFLFNEKNQSMSYYNAFKIIKEWIPNDCIFVSEGANTMDIARTVFDQTKPRTRLDAGTFGTMGLGLGYAIASQLAHPSKKVVCIQGDSAFGFSCSDLETCCRLKLPIVFIIINNNGIYSGVDKETWSAAKVEDLPTTALLPEANYERIAEAFGAKGYLVKTEDELKNTLHNLSNKEDPVVINCLISPSSQRKAQEFNWLSRSDSSSKL